MTVSAYANDPRVNPNRDGSYTIVVPTCRSSWHVLGIGDYWRGVDAINGGAVLRGDTADDVIGQIIGDPQQ